MPSSTGSFQFTAVISGSFRKGERYHLDRLSAARNYLSRTACRISYQFSADQPAEAQDAINAVFGEEVDCPSGSYRFLVASSSLRSTPEGLSAAIKMRQDKSRIERLEALRVGLYSDPGLMLIDFLDRNPDALHDCDALLAKYRQAASSLQGFEVWWLPLMAAWNELAAQTSTHAGVDASFAILLNAIRKLDKRLAEAHRLPPLNDRL
ncbi:hypothetical protein ACIG87_04990 [Micromonospora sp. NPDC051925]|uniref:hypothetical protein n=1 Tax=Micromonospora sp. NPDC051925 TaxID=3364288 RepID=UPI0037C50014